MSKLSTVPPVVSTEYNFQYNVTQISGSLGSYIRVLCLVDPVTDVVSYVWQKNGDNIGEPSIFSLYLTLRDLAVEDGGQYRCEVVTVSCGTTYSPAISINTPPGSVMITGPNTVTEGHAFQLTCSANGWPPPTYDWSFNGGPPIAEGSMYSVSSAHSTNAGEYTCTARNSRGQMQGSLTITVSGTQVPASSPSLPQPSEKPVNVPMSTYKDTTRSESSQAAVSTTTTTKVQRSTTTRSVTSTPTLQPTTTDDKGSSSDDRRLSDAQTAPFVVLLALSVALLLALIAVIIIVSLMVVWLARSSPRRRKGDKRRLLEEGEGEGEGESGVEMEVAKERATPPRDTDKLSGTVNRSPTSCVNIAFGQESEEEEEEEEEEEGEGDSVMLVRSGNREGASAKVSPQRYQQQSSALDSVSKKQSHPISSSSALSHSVSMDVPVEERPGARADATSAGKPQPNSHHLTPPRDRRRVGHQTRAKSAGKALLIESQSNSDKLHLLTAMDGPAESEGLTQQSNDTILTSLSAEVGREQREMCEKWETGEAGEVREVGEQEKSDVDEVATEQEKLCDKMQVPEEEEMEGEESERVREDAEMSFIGEVDEEEEEEEAVVATEPVVVIRETMGEATATFEQLENYGVMLGEGSAGLLSCALSSGAEVEQGRGEDVKVGWGEGEDVRVGEWDKDEEEETEEKREEVETRTMSEKSGALPLTENGAGSLQTGACNGDEDGQADIHRLTVFVEKAKKMGRTSFIAELDRSHPLTVEEIHELVEEAKTSVKSSRLAVEYKTVPHNSVQSLPLSTAEKHKNRYRNVLPNPHSAVRLSDIGVPGSQYINANYIRGYGGRERQYIATQGPTTNTAADFWRMVWEQEVSIIVMTTSLVENGSQKCVRYWPTADDVDTVVHGNILVRNNYEEVTDSYVTSYLSIYLQSPDGVEIGEERDVYHFWHTAWCDFGVPRETSSTLRLREAVDAFRTPSSSPIIVHCSAGLGRSGTFMAIDMGIQQYEAEGVVDPTLYLCSMRQDRGGIVQTPDQYVYIHRALRDYMTT